MADYNNGSYRVDDAVPPAGRPGDRRGLILAMLLAVTTALAFVLIANVSPPNAAADTPVKTTANLYLRSGPGASHAQLALIPKGTTLTSKDTSGAWQKLTYNGKTGWSYGDYLTKATSKDGSPASAPDTPVDNQCPATAKACVDLTNNQTWLQKDGKVSYGPVEMTSGKPGHLTRTGSFTVGWKNKNHVSSLYGDPMPNAIFYDGGIAFHEGSLKEQSHGCIHLSKKASQTYWDSLAVGDAVVVWGTAS